jgi:hypothetical protein
MTTTLLRSSLVAALAMLVWSPLARAQSPPSPASSTQSAFLNAASDDERPTTTTFLGDTGIWYVPTAEILRSGTWSLGGNRRGTNYVQGLTSVADFTGGAAVGIGNHVELFGAFLFDTRINRNTPPVFVDEARQGGIVARFPRVNESWTGNNVGDLYVGTKINLLSEYRRAPLALAVRGIVKLPTGDDDAGVSTGKTDVMADVIASKELGRFFETAMYVGYEVRGNPDGFEAPNGSYRWGTGVAFPSRSPLRLSAEVDGDLPSNYRATLTDNSVAGDDGSVRPFESDIRNRTRATGGLTYQMPAGFFMGTGLSWNAPRYWDWQVRIGYRGRSRKQPRAFTRHAGAGKPHRAGGPSRQDLYLRGRVLRPRRLHTARRNALHPGQRGESDAGGSVPQSHNRGTHLRHRDAGIQRRAGRASRECGQRLLREPRHRGEPAADDQLRRGRSRARQRARRHAALEPPCRAGRQSAALTFTQGGPVRAA